MKQLSGMDNLLLTLDQGNQHWHVASLAIYDPSTAPGGKVRFKSVLNHFARQINKVKLFRRRLVEVPFGLARPFLVEDATVDIEYHVRHIALPQPGDWRQLMIQVARIHSRPLDRSKPLWEAYIIEGLDRIPGVPPNAFAVYTKLHHALVDGEAGAELIRALHSLTPEAEPVDADEKQIVFVDRDPTTLELYARAAGGSARQLWGASKLLVGLSGRAFAVGKQLLASAGGAGHALAPVGSLGQLVNSPAIDIARWRKPATRFDQPVSAHRVVDAVGFPLAEIQKIRTGVEHATINDVFMAAAGGALRAYLEAKGELPTKSLSAMVPITTRGAAKDADAGNQVGMTAMSLRTDIADPLERLAAVRRGSGKNKAFNAAIGKELPGQLIDVLPVGISALLIKKGLTAVANVTVSNVRGPDVPLYMAGAKAVAFMPISVIIDGIGLNLTGFSYNGTLWVCFVCCRKIMPDPAVFTRCLSASLAELVQAVDAPAAPPAKRKAAPRRRKAAGEVAPPKGRQADAPDSSEVR